MKKVRFGACEFAFPCWGAFAIKLAHEAGFEGIQIADAGGYLQPHPGNNGYVEYERYGLDLRRKDSFPLLFCEVQEDYLEAAEAYRMELNSLYLYTLEHQGFIKYAPSTPQGAQCRESVRNGILAAEQMHIPVVTIPAKGMFGLAQNDYAFAALQYAAEVAADHGVRLAILSDLTPKKQCRMVDALGEQVQLAFDMYAPLVYGSGTPSVLLKEVGVGRIDHIRVRDSAMDPEGFADFDSHVTLLGQGNAAFSDAVNAIQSLDYSGWVISDTRYYHPALRAAGESYLSAAQKDVATLQKVFAEEQN